MKSYQLNFLDVDREYLMPNFDDGMSLHLRWEQVCWDEQLSVI